MLIYHIVLPEIWEHLNAEIYKPASLDDEGFVHCSFREQLDGVIERYYSNAESLIVLELETDRLMSRVINEPSTGNEIYPHIYGPINLDAVVSQEIRTR
jgi:uncharacterized protein (DUF952 family)